MMFISQHALLQCAEECAELQYSENKMASCSNLRPEPATGVGNFSFNVSVADCTCPICMCILIEPVTMPCKHELCMPCFKQNVQETSLTCPICRLRISTWTRRATKNNKLIDHNRWQQIQNLFPDKVKNRLEGIDDDSSDEEIFPVTYLKIAQPGEIRKEYEEEIKKLEEARLQAAAEEQALSEHLIRELEAEERERARREQEELDRQKLSDEHLAKELSEALQQNADMPTPNVAQLVQKQRAMRSHSASNCTRSASNTMMDKFVKRTNRNSSLAGERPSSRNLHGCASHDNYPYSCISPAQKDSENPLGDSENSPSQTPLRRRSLENASYVYVDSGSDSPSSELDLSTKKVKVKQEPKMSSSSHSIVEVEQLQNHSKASASTSMASILSDSIEILSKTPQPAPSAKPKAPQKQAEKSVPAGRVSKRSASVESNDSISQELVHFKPILACPRTPPRRLAGRIVEPPIIRSTPRNLSSLEDMCDVITDVPGTSPVVARRLRKLAKERQQQIRAMSKSTSTDRLEEVMKERKYASCGTGERSIHVSKSDSLQHLSSRSKRNAAASLASHLELDSQPSHQTVKKLRFETDSSEHNNKEIAMQDKLPKLPEILPLESNITDFDDFGGEFVLDFDGATSSDVGGIKASRSDGVLVEGKVKTNEGLQTSPGKVYQMKKTTAVPSMGRKLNFSKKDIFSPQRSIKDWVNKKNKLYHDKPNLQRLLADNQDSPEGETSAHGDPLSKTDAPLKMVAEVQGGSTCSVLSSQPGTHGSGEHSGALLPTDLHNVERDTASSKGSADSNSTSQYKSPRKKRPVKRFIEESEDIYTSTTPKKHNPQCSQEAKNKSPVRARVKNMQEETLISEAKSECPIELEPSEKERTQVEKSNCVKGKDINHGTPSDQNKDGGKRGSKRKGTNSPKLGNTPTESKKHRNLSPDQGAETLYYDQDRLTESAASLAKCGHEETSQKGNKLNIKKGAAKNDSKSKQTSMLFFMKENNQSTAGGDAVRPEKRKLDFNRTRNVSGRSKGASKANTASSDSNSKQPKLKWGNQEITLSASKKDKSSPGIAGRVRLRHNITNKVLSHESSAERSEVWENGHDCEDKEEEEEEEKVIPDPLLEPDAYRIYLEEQDRLLAMRLQRDFELEAKLSLNSIRTKGSEDEYLLRRRRRAVVGGSSSDR